MLSARNIIEVVIEKLITNETSALVYGRANNKLLCAHITSISAANLELKVGAKAYFIFKASSVIVAKNECRLRTSSANELAGVLKELKKGAINDEAIIDCGGITISAIITRASSERLNLTAGDNINALIKASNVLVAIAE